MKRKLISICLLSVLLMTACPPASDTMIEKENEMSTKIQLIRNATMRIDYAGKTFLTDPLLADKNTYPGFLNREELVTPMVALPMTIDEVMMDVDALLVSHTHIPAEDVPTPASDHFDALAINTIDKSMPIYTQAFDEAGLKRVGFNNVTSITDTLTLDSIKLTRITGKHVDIDALLPIIGESSGYVLEAEGHPTILWTGDTLLTEEIKSAISTFKPDVIITHSGGAQLPIDAEGNVAKLIMEADATIEIAKFAPHAKIVAIHMEALDHCPVTRKDLRAEATTAGIKESQLLIPTNGEILEF